MVAVTDDSLHDTTGRGPMDDATPTPVRVHEYPPMRAVSIRLDENGEILLAGYSTGKIYRMVRPKGP